MKIEQLAQQSLDEKRKQKQRESEERLAENLQAEKKLIADARKSLLAIVDDEDAVNELEIEVAPGAPLVYAYLNKRTGKAISAVFVSDGGYWQWYAGRDIKRDDLAFNTLEELGERLSRFRVWGNMYDHSVETRWLTPEAVQPRH